MNTTSYLEHHGVKGMKWGIRRTPEQLGHRKSSMISRKTFEKMKKIHSELSQKEKYYVGDMSISKYTTYAKVKNGAYIILDDYRGEYKDEHPYSGKIVGIAASKKSRGTGVTDQLIRGAIRDNENDRLIAEIDSDNVASRKLFQRNGFILLDKKDGIDYYAYSNYPVNELLSKYGKEKSR